MNGHQSTIHQFRIIALHLIKNIVSDFRYDCQFNQVNQYWANKVYANFDDNYEQVKRGLILSLNDSL